MPTTDHSTISLAKLESPKERDALIRLLGDEDPLVYAAVRTRIIQSGPESLNWLRPAMLTNDPVQRRHIGAIVRHFDREKADSECMVYFLQDENAINLEVGAFKLAKTQHPEFNVAGYVALLDSFAYELKDVLGKADKYDKLLVRANEYFFKNLKFTGNEKNYYDPDNSYVNRVMDRRTGNPITLAWVYTAVMRRLGYPVSPVGLPGHSVCRFMTSTEEVYIDPFNSGKLLSRAECIDPIRRCKYDVDDAFLQPMSDRRTLARMCGNLEESYKKLQNDSNAKRLQRYCSALAR